MPTDSKKRRHRGPPKDRWRNSRRAADRNRRRRTDAQMVFPFMAPADGGEK
jgi:hypothetical protein